MRVLLIVDSYLPEPKATGPLYYSLAQELMQRGHSVTILTVSDKITQNYTTADEDGVRVVRVRSPQLKGVPLVRRAINEVLLSKMIWSRAAEAIAPIRAEAVAFYSPTIFFGPLVRRLKRLWGCRTALVLRDIFPQWALDAGQMRSGPHFRLFQHYAELQYQVADRIGVQSPNNVRYFEQRLPRYLPKIEVVFNWVGGAEAGGIEDPRTALGIASDTPVLLYGGNLGSAQDPELLLETARALTISGKTSAFVLIVGEGSAAERVRSVIASERLSNIAFWPSVSQERFLAIARSCDAGVIALNPALTTHNFPGKLLTYIAAGLPVLASVNRGNDLRGMVEQAGAGLCNWADEPREFIANAQRICEDGPLRKQLSDGVRARLRERFSVERAADFVTG